MNKLSSEELHSISGGGIKLSIGAYMILGGAASFIIGLFNGYLRPLGCSVSK